MSNSPKKSWGLTKMHYLCSPKWCHGRVVRQRSAKPSTAVRFCLAPPKTPFSNAERGFAIHAQLLSQSGVRANHLARQSPIYALLGQIGVRGCLNLSSSSTVAKVNYLCIRNLYFRSVRGGLQEAMIIVLSSWQIIPFFGQTMTQN